MASNDHKEKFSGHLLFSSTRRSFLLLLTLASIAFPQGATMAPTTFKEVSGAAGVKIFRATYGNPIGGDFNNDGNEDVFVINHGDVPSLYRNNGDGTFTDVRPASGITSSGDRHGAAWGDYDNDGHLDLFITIGADLENAVGAKTDQLYGSILNLWVQKALDME